jgi:hypothetical protein
MNRRGLLAVPLLLGFLATTAPGCRARDKPRKAPLPGASGKLAGAYRARATNPGMTGSYAADVVIKLTGAYYSLDWRLAAGRNYRGVGIELPEFLAVGWGVEDHHVFVYEISGSRLIGRWASAKSNGKLGEEVLEGPAGLNGNHQIVEGIDPSGAAYDGTVSIAANGAVYRLQRRTSAGNAQGGVGIKKGNRLIVGAGPGGGAGVMVYTIQETGLSGQWAQPASNMLGTEYLTKR